MISSDANPRMVMHPSAGRSAKDEAHEQSKHVGIRMCPPIATSPAMEIPKP